MLVKDELKSEDISISDIKFLCLDIAKNDKKAHRLFNGKKLKPKYSEAITKVHNQLEKAIDSGDISKVDKLLDEFSRVVDRYKKLKPSIDLKVREEGANEYTYTVTEFWNGEKGNISNLGRMLSFAKQNTRERLRARKQEEKERKEYERKKEFYDDVDEKIQRGVVEKNIRKGRDDYYQRRTRTEAMSSFEAETRGKVESEVEAAKKMYGDSDSGRAYKEIKKARDGMPDYMKE